ncbi:MAG TPA: ClpX C4-type zinc finger protein [Myxococcaceae bacterium]|jgi:hypothetical protein
MASPRDHIRAAQAAELRGDKAGAIAELVKAAELFQQASNSARALQLLRHARKLDPTRVDIAEQISKLEWLPDTSIAGALQGARPGEPVLQLKLEPDELAERQRLIEEALREAGMPSSGGDAPDEVKRWLVEEPAVAREPPRLYSASERALEWARQREEEEKALGQWLGEEPEEEPSGFKAAVSASPVGELSAVNRLPMGREVEPILAEPILADVESMPFQELAAPSEFARESAASSEPSMFDRGPTRADPALDAWCSFCCRPRLEVGEMVAGPTGSFICAACVSESQSLLGLERAEPSARPAPPRRKEEPTAPALVGQQEARSLLTRGLEAGARRLLVLGPEGCGKSVWFQELVSQDLGVLVTVDALEQGAGGSLLLVEDVDRLQPEARARLTAFLARHPERTVVMSARGGTNVTSFVLHGPPGSLPLFTSHALFPVLRGAVPLPLIDQIQLVIPVQAPSEAEFIEIARRRLAARGSEVTLSDDVLAAFAAAAARSPRLGHELTALLGRVLSGSWSLHSPAEKDLGDGKPSSRRGRRKGNA